MTRVTLVFLTLFSAHSALAQTGAGPLAVLDVPFISQSEDLCGGAAAAMVLRYWGQRGVDAGSFAPLLDRSKAGIETTALVADLNRREWNATGIRGTDVTLREELRNGRPVIALIEDRPGRYHYVVIVAASDHVVVFHDPARAPFRAMSPAEFHRRWDAAGRWMAVVTPKSQLPIPRSQIPHTERADNATAGRAGGAATCDALVAEGVARAQANQVEAAEQVLTTALGCPGVAAMRELAGVRVLQRRWSDAASLATAAVAEAPHDQYLWRLLGTARFLLDDRAGALRAWNVVGEPKIDLVRVDGLTRTRQPVVERLVGVAPGTVLTPDVVLLARRRLRDLPAAFSTRVDFTPVPSGLAELHAVVAERRVVPAGTWTIAAIGVSAAVERDVRVATGSPTGGGESLEVEWRFWPDRPRAAARVAAPAPWGGVWGIDVATERQPFSVSGTRVSSVVLSPDSMSRSGGRLFAAAWITPVLRLGARGGIERWDAPSRGAYGTAGGFASYSSRDDRVQGRVVVDIWSGQRRSFATTAASVGWRSSTTDTGHVWLGDGGVSFAGTDTPLDAWFAGDTGHAREVLLRAHPVLEDGGLRTERLGRTLVHASGEARQWWTAKSVLHLGAAAFVDVARTSQRLDAPAIGDVDAGVGLRVAAPLLPGVVRLDVARGLRDGATAVSVVYERGRD